MSKHTPGPWEVVKKSDNSGYMVDATNQPIAEIRYIKGESASQKGIQQEQANARLIASSPTMYKYISKLATLGDTDAIEIIAKATQ